MSCTLFFTAGAKGGSGKTTAAKFLVTYLREHGELPLLMDLDDENHALARFFPEALQINLHQEFAQDVVIEKALSGEHTFIVADLKAGSGHEVLKWFLDLPFDQLKERGVHLVCLGSVTSAPDSVQSFLNWDAALSHHVNYIVFRNLKDGENLYDYDQTLQALEFRETYHPGHVTVPKLSPLYQTELEIRKLTITEVLGLTNHTSSEDRIGPVLSPLLARARLRNYQRGIYEQLEQVLQSPVDIEGQGTNRLRGAPMAEVSQHLNELQALVHSERLQGNQTQRLESPAGCRAFLIPASAPPPNACHENPTGLCAAIQQADALGLTCRSLHESVAIRLDRPIGQRAPKRCLRGRPRWILERPLLGTTDQKLSSR